MELWRARAKLFLEIGLRHRIWHGAVRGFKLSLWRSKQTVRTLVIAHYTTAVYKDNRIFKDQPAGQVPKHGASNSHHCNFLVCLSQRQFVPTGPYFSNQSADQAAKAKTNRDHHILGT
jgi:hypothetical protein